MLARPEAEVRVHVLESADLAFLSAIAGGATLGAAAEAMTEMTFDFGRALVGLTGLGVFRAIGR